MSAGRFSVERDGRAGWNILYDGSIIDHQYAHHVAMAEAEVWERTLTDAALPFLFVYGTLLDSVGLFAPGATLVSHETLRHYHLMGLPGGTFPLLLAHAGGCVHGQRWRLPAPPADSVRGLRALDAYEGEGRLHARERVTLEGGQDAWAYVWRAGPVFPAELHALGPRWQGHRVADLTRPK